MTHELIPDGRKMDEIKVAIGGLLHLEPATIRECAVFAFDDIGRLTVGAPDLEGFTDLLTRVLEKIRSEKPPDNDNQEGT